MASPLSSFLLACPCYLCFVQSCTYQLFQIFHFLSSLLQRQLWLIFNSSCVDAVNKGRATVQSALRRRRINTPWLFLICLAWAPYIYGLRSGSPLVEFSTALWMGVNPDFIGQCLKIVTNEIAFYFKFLVYGWVKLSIDNSRGSPWVYMPIGLGLLGVL